MKIIIEPTSKIEHYSEQVDGLILSLKGLSVQSENYYTKEEIKTIKEKYPHLEIFVSINKNIFNEDLENLQENLLYLESLSITGILFYDLALLKLKQELNLKTDLVWNQTHMVNNYKTCDYYFSKGVKYALLGKEITLKEIKEIASLSSITSMVEVISMPTVAFSDRKLITNYYKDLNKEGSNKLTVTEKITNQDYELIEDENGTNFLLKQVTNGTGIIKDLFDINVEYIVIREYGIKDIIFKELLTDLKKYIEQNCQDISFIEKYKMLGDNTNFFFKETIYRVKKKSGE